MHQVIVVTVRDDDGNEVFRETSHAYGRGWYHLGPTCWFGSEWHGGCRRRGNLMAN